jgi:hypothetical protein
MDELQDRLVRVGLDVLAKYGFALAGGYALQAHQLVDRLSEDVDIFTDSWDPDDSVRLSTRCQTPCGETACA